MNFRLLPRGNRDKTARTTSSAEIHALRPTSRLHDKTPAKGTLPCSSSAFFRMPYMLFDSFSMSPEMSFACFTDVSISFMSAA